MIIPGIVFILAGLIFYITAFFVFVRDWTKEYGSTMGGAMMFNPLWVWGSLLSGVGFILTGAAHWIFGIVSIIFLFGVSLLFRFIFKKIRKVNLQKTGLL